MCVLRMYAQVSGMCKIQWSWRETMRWVTLYGHWRYLGLPILRSEILSSLLVLKTVL